MLQTPLDSFGPGSDQNAETKAARMLSLNARAAVTLIFKYELPFRFIRPGFLSKFTLTEHPDDAHVLRIVCDLEVTLPDKIFNGV